MTSPGMELCGLKRRPIKFAFFVALLIPVVASAPDGLSDDLSPSDVGLSVATPGTDVFALHGTWDGTATTDIKTNAYIAAILSAYIYGGSLQATGLANFSTAFTTHVAKPLGITRAWYYNGPMNTAWAFLDAPTSQLVVFRGTNIKDYDNVWTDAASIHPQAFTEFTGNSVRIGTGFACAFLNNANLLMPELLSFRASSDKKDKPLWVTGHSLGAALATLFAAYAEKNGIPVQGVYTFGSPYVGLQDWADAYSSSPLGSRTYRYFADGDPVPGLPPKIFGSWVHVGLEQPLAPCVKNASSSRPSSDGAQVAEASNTSNTSVPASVSYSDALGTTATTASKGAKLNLFGCKNPLVTFWLKFQTCGLVRVNDTTNPSTMEVVSVDCSKTAEGQQPAGRLHSQPNEDIMMTDVEGIEASALAASLPSYMMVATSDASTADEGDSGTGVPMTRLNDPFASHSILTSYLQKIYNCTLTHQQMAAVPDYYFHWTAE